MGHQNSFSELNAMHATGQKPLLKFRWRASEKAPDYELEKHKLELQHETKQNKRKQPDSRRQSQT